VLISKKGRDYRKAASARLKDKNLEPLEGPLVVDIELHLPDRRKRDIDNVLKAVLALRELSPTPRVQAATRRRGWILVHRLSIRTNMRNFGNLLNRFRFWRRGGNWRGIWRHGGLLIAITAQNARHKREGNRKHVTLHFFISLTKLELSFSDSVSDSVARSSSIFSTSRLVN